MAKNAEIFIINGWLSGEEKRDGLAKISFSIMVETKQYFGGILYEEVYWQDAIFYP